MKKVLSFVLVLTLVLGSFSMAFAGNLTDADKISQGEAVDVMVATGIIAGYPDGSFGPDKNVTREQMAKMIAVLMNGGEDIGAYYASASKFTDTQGWSAGYVAYCASKGIIAGRDAKTFDPLANVTATEAAKMLLVALGYNAEYEKYVGTNWKVNILADAKTAKLFKGIKISDYDKAIDRETAARMIFNAMQAKTVEYDKESAIKIGDIEVTQTSQAKYVEDENGDPIYLYEDKFDGDLEKTSTGTRGLDDFGRPAHTWTYDKDKIGTYADEADYTFVSGDDYATVADAIDDIDDSILDEGEEGEIKATTLNGGTFDSVIVGDVIELFDVTDDEEVDQYKAVVIRYTFTQISDVDTDVTKADAKDDVTCYVTIDGDRINDTDFEGFDAKTYVEDAFVAVVVKGDKVIASYIPEKKQGEVTKFNDSAIYLDGTKYDTVTDVAVVNDSNDPVSMEAGDTYDLYLTADNYVIGAVLYDAEDNDNYGIITAVKENDGDWAVANNKTSYSAKILSSDLKETTYDTKAFAAADEKSDAYTKLETLNVRFEDRLVKYTLNDSGKLKAIDFGNDGLDGKVSKKGIVNGKVLSQDVVAFEYDADDEEYTTYTYKDLLEADIQGSYFLKNGEITYILLDSYDDGSSNDVLGFYMSAKKYTNKDGAYYEVKLLVNGEEKVYETDVDKDAVTDFFTDEKEAGNLDVNTVLKVTLNGDDQIKAAGYANLPYSTESTDEFATGVDGIVYGDGTATDFESEFGEVVKVNGKNIAIGDEDNYLNIADATVYKLTLDGTDLDLAKHNGSVAKGGHVILMQLSEDSEAWDTVIYVTAADWTEIF